MGPSAPWNRLLRSSNGVKCQASDRTEAGALAALARTKLREVPVCPVSSWGSGARCMRPGSKGLSGAPSRKEGTVEIAKCAVAARRLRTREVVRSRERTVEWCTVVPDEGVSMNPPRTLLTARLLVLLAAIKVGPRAPHRREEDI
jgi:hypothetical protein